MSLGKIVVAGWLLALSWSALGQEVVLKVHHFLPPGAPAHAKLIAPWCDRLSQASQGKLKCQIYPAMQLGGTAPQLFEQAKDGVADVVWTVTGYTPGRFPRTEVFELPFMMINPEATARAMWEYVQTHAAEEFKDVKPLAFHPHGPGVFHVTKRPIKTLADFKRLKIRAPTRLTTKMLAAFGATPVGMPMPQVSESLARGVIDGALMPYEVVPAVKVHEMVKYHSETDKSQPAVYTTVLALLMNQARYDNLPVELKKIIDSNSGIELSALAARTFVQADIPGRQLAARNAINIVPGSEVEKWRKAAQPVTDGWIADMSNKKLDGRALIDTARGLIVKHTSAR